MKYKFLENIKYLYSIKYNSTGFHLILIYFMFPHLNYLKGIPKISTKNGYLNTLNILESL